jgi:hypothetical protein
MKIKFFSVILWIALSAKNINAGAQKTYTQGVISYVANVRGQDVEVKGYFTTDHFVDFIGSKNSRLF